MFFSFSPGAMNDFLLFPLGQGTLFFPPFLSANQEPFDRSATRRLTAGTGSSAFQGAWSNSRNEKTSGGSVFKCVVMHFGSAKCPRHCDQFTAESSSVPFQRRCRPHSATDCAGRWIGSPSSSSRSSSLLTDTSSDWHI